MKSPFLNYIRDFMRARHYSERTIDAYLSWIFQYIVYHDKKHPKEMGTAEVEDFLSYLITSRNLAMRTQNQALNALVFLYKHILHDPIDVNMRFKKSNKSKKLPTVLTIKEVSKVLENMPPSFLLPAVLWSAFGSGIKISTLIMAHCEYGVRKAIRIEWLRWPENYSRRYSDSSNTLRVFGGKMLSRVTILACGSLMHWQLNTQTLTRSSTGSFCSLLLGCLSTLLLI
jgi:integrase